MHLGQLVAQLCCQDVGERHELLCLICGISKHVSLVTGTCLLQGLCSKTMDSLPNVWTLLFQVDKDLYRRSFQLMCNIQVLPTVLQSHPKGIHTTLPTLLDTSTNRLPSWMSFRNKASDAYYKMPQQVRAFVEEFKSRV